MKLSPLLLLAATLAAFPPPLPAATVAVRQVALGNVFFTDEPVRIAVAVEGAETIAWTATDFLGQPVAHGSAPVDRRIAVVAPTLGPGYYDLALDTPNGTHARTSLAILPPVDVRKLPADSAYGVMTHFAQFWDTDLLGLVARAGIKHIRDEQYWQHIETARDRFTYPPEFEKYMAEASRLGIDPLVVLDYGNHLYDDAPNPPEYGVAPFTDAGRAAYARYGREILRHYGPQVGAVEVWNEYNGTFAKGPAADDRPGFYFQMLKTAYPALKQARPDVPVVGVSAVSVPLPYFESLFKLGALKYMDAVSLHPYRTQGQPEGLEKQLARVQALIRQYSPDEKPRPLWITELGWSVKAADNRSDVVVTEADQAKYLARAVTLAQSAGVERFYWYNARNDPNFPNMGLLRAPDDPRGRYAPKPAYVAYATLTRQLTGARFEAREPTVNEDTYCLRFRRGEQTTRVMWSLAPRTLALKADGALAVADLVGAARTFDPEKGEVKLPLTDAPVYVRGNVTGLPPVEREPGERVADSEDGFSSEQGADGWSYGSFEAPAPGGPYTPEGWQPLPRYHATLWGYEWVSDLTRLMIDSGSAHPGSTQGHPVWAVRRWTCRAAGTLRLRGTFSHSSQGDGTTARVFVDGRELWQQLIGGPDTPGHARCNVSTPVRPGSRVDIAVDPGQGINTDYDNTPCHITLTLLP